MIQLLLEIGSTCPPEVVFHRPSKCSIPKKGKDHLPTLIFHGGYVKKVVYPTQDSSHHKVHGLDVPGIPRMEPSICDKKASWVVGRSKSSTVFFP